MLQPCVLKSLRIFPGRLDLAVALYIKTLERKFEKYYLVTPRRLHIRFGAKNGSFYMSVCALHMPATMARTKKSAKRKAAGLAETKPAAPQVENLRPKNRKPKRRRPKKKENKLEIVLTSVFRN